LEEGDKRKLIGLDCFLFEPTKTSSLQNVEKMRRGAQVLGIFDKIAPLF